MKPKFVLMRKRLPLILGALGIVIVLFAYPFYQRVFSSSVNLQDGDTYDLYIPTGADYIYVGKKLLEDKVISNPEGFQWVADQMNYPRKVIPGRYVIKDGMSNRELIQLLGSGKQTPINFTFVKFRTEEDFALHAAGRFEFGKSELLQVFQDEAFLSKEFGLTKETLMGIFVPNTYEMWWNTSPRDFVKRMYKEYRSFWNETRKAQRQRINLTRMEIMTLASIVEEESNKVEDRPIIAGVYLNRIRKRMKLQADPTVRYAVGDFTLRRILNSHLELDSPYNTYLYPGIPPGPICTPSIPAIDAVLANQHHDYYYFCARTDGSGYHHFSKTLEEHNAYAQAFHNHLDQRNIQQ